MREVVTDWPNKLADAIQSAEVLHYDAHEPCLCRACAMVMALAVVNALAPVCGCDLVDVHAALSAAIEATVEAEKGRG